MKKKFATALSEARKIAVTTAQPAPVIRPQEVKSAPAPVHRTPW
jgi:hypothetical protein